MRTISPKNGRPARVLGKPSPVKVKNPLIWLKGKRSVDPIHAPVLRGAFPSLLRWDWAFENPYRWNVWTSINGGASFLSGDYWANGVARQFAPDGGSESYFIVGVDEAGNEITERSNAVIPDDALYPAPVLTGHFEDSSLTWVWGYMNPVRWNVYQSISGGGFFLVGDYWTAGANRSFAPDGGSETYLVVGVNGSGVEITERSNLVCPDLVAPIPLARPAPVLSHQGLDVSWALNFPVGYDGIVVETRVEGGSWTYFDGVPAEDGSMSGFVWLQYVRARFTNGTLFTDYSNVDQAGT